MASADEPPVVRLELAEEVARTVGRKPPPPFAGQADSDSEDEDEANEVEGELQLGSAVASFSIARFGASSARLTGAAVRADPLLADAELANATEVSGCIAVIERGACSFVQKARRAQAAGAIGVLFVNTDEELFIIGGEAGDDEIELPVVMVRASDGQPFLTELEAGPSTISFGFVWSSSEEEDSDDEDGGIFATWGAAIETATEPGLDRDDMLKQIRLSAGWHTLKPVPDEDKQRGAKRELSARDLLMVSLRSGKELLQKVQLEGELTPRAEREMRLAVAHTPATTKRIVTAMSARRGKVTVDSESDGEHSSDWSDEEEDEQEQEQEQELEQSVASRAVPRAPVAAITGPPRQESVCDTTDGAEMKDGNQRQVIPPVEPEPQPVLIPALSENRGISSEVLLSKTHSLMTDEWEESQSSTRTRESSISVGESSLGSSLSRESSTTAGSASNACLFVTLSDGQTLQVERPDTDPSWRRLTNDLREAAGVITTPGSAPLPCTLVLLREDGSQQCAVDASSAKDLPDGAFVTLQIGSNDISPPEVLELQIELPESLLQHPKHSEAPAMGTAETESTALKTLDSRQVAASMAFGAADASPRMTIRAAAEATTPGRGRRASRGGITPRRIVAGMKAADDLEGDLCQAAAMQNATAKQLLAVCAESGSGWQEKYGMSSGSDGEGRQLRAAREELVRRAVGLAAAWQPRIRQAKATAGQGADRHATLAVQGEFARAVDALEGLREEVAGIAAATERSLSAEPPALALLEWWASHTDACHTAYRGFLHADGAVKDCVDALASDARLTLATTVEEIRSALAIQHTQAASAAQLPLDAALAAATAVANAGRAHGNAGCGGTPTVQRGSAIGSRAVLPTALTAKQRKRSRLARRVLLARRQRAQYLAGLQAAGGAAAASVESLDPRGRHSTASFRASLSPPKGTWQRNTAASAPAVVTSAAAELLPPPPPPRPGSRYNVLDTTGDSGMLLRALARDGADVDVLSQWLSFPELKHILIQRLAVVDPVGLDAFFGCAVEGYVEVGGFVRENANALARLVTPQISKGYLKKRRARGGYSLRFFVLDSAAGELRYYRDERTANEATRNKAKETAGDGRHTGTVHGHNSSPVRDSGGVISMDTICGVFNKPGTKDGHKIKLIGMEREYTLVALSSRNEALGWARALDIARDRAAARAGALARSNSSTTEGGLSPVRASGSHAATAGLQARVAALRVENERLQRHARALHELQARDSNVLSL